MSKHITAETEAQWAATMDMIDSAGAAAWVHPGDAIDAAEDIAKKEQPVDSILDAVDLFSRLFDWISAGRGDGGVSVRVWVVRYHLYPAACQPSTLRAMASDRDVSHQAIDDVCAKFRRAFPEVKWPKRDRRNHGTAASAEATNRRHRLNCKKRKANCKNFTIQRPPGKESLQKKHLNGGVPTPGISARHG